MVIAILGRQPKLGLAELESLYGADAVQPLGDHSALLDVDQVDGRLLGGTIKLAKPLTELPYTDWNKLSAYTAKALPEHLAYLPEGKLKLGLSVYGLSITAPQLFRSGLALKKVCRANKRSVRIVPATGQTLNSAQVLHNQMTGSLGMELNYIKNGNKTWLAQTTWVQDIDDYSRRDYGRPKRDAFVGMLPPKLAQTMLHLAKVNPGDRVLDPFCGTGVVLQEAALLGCKINGSDVDARMIDFSRENLKWLQDIYRVEIDAQLDVADATKNKWQQPVGHVVCETYLGQPLSGLPAPEKLGTIISDCNTIISKFLTNLKPQLKTSDSPLCIAVPAWRVGGGFKHLPLLDRLEEMGYNRLRFKHASWDDLVYHREDQIVARELLVLEVK